MSEAQAPQFFPANDSVADSGGATSRDADHRLEIVEFEPLPPPPLKPPGPGLPEALAWCCGVFTAHAAASIAITLLVLGLLLFAGQSVSDILSGLADITNDYLLLIVGGDQMLVLLVTLCAVALRFQGRMYRTLNVTPPRPLHVLIVAGLMLPLSTLCGEAYRLAFQQWSRLTDLLPALRSFDEMNGMEALQGLSKEAPLWLLLVIIAVGPALAEELVFRGVIGRGLVARWGVAAGVLLTSLMFAAVHFHPAHALAVLPLGIALHLIYLATRSFWAPVLLHFLNNAWATVATKFAGGEATIEALDQAASPTLLLASLTAVIVLGALLFTTRTRYVTPNGEEWNPGYFTVEVPAAGAAVRVDLGHYTGRNLLTAGSAWVAFGLAFVAEVAALAR